MMEPFEPQHVPTVLEEVFAPWVRELKLSLVTSSPAKCEFLMPRSALLVREGGPGGGVVCGQALGAAADTVSVLALALMAGKLRPNTTTDFAIRFLRPIPMGDVRMEVTALSNGRRLAVTEVLFFAEGSTKPGAQATCCFAFLDDGGS